MTVRSPFVALALFCFATACAMQGEFAARNPGRVLPADFSGSAPRGADGPRTLALSQEPLPQRESAENKVTEAEVAWLLMRAMDESGDAPESEERSGGERGSEGVSPAEERARARLASLCHLKEAEFAAESCSSAQARLAFSGEQAAFRKATERQWAHLGGEELGKAIFAHLNQSLASSLQEAETAACRKREEFARGEVEASASARARELAEAVRRSQLAQARLEATRAAKKAELDAYLRTNGTAAAFLK